MELIAFHLVVFAIMMTIFLAIYPCGYEAYQLRRRNERKIPKCKFDEESKTQ